MKKTDPQGESHRHLETASPSSADNHARYEIFGGLRLRGSWRPQSDLLCRVGDLAIVVQAYNLSNLGKVVRVVSRYSLEAANYIPNDFRTYDWVVVTHGYLTWSRLHPYQRWRRKRGPVADNCLYPIRGLRMSDQELDKLVKRPGFGCRYYSLLERPVYSLCM